MIRSVLTAPIKGKRVLLRVDFNVPLHNNKIVDDNRIRAALPTIKAILKKKPLQLILMSHLGRPDGIVESLRMKPIAARLSTLLGKPVTAVRDCVDLELGDSPIILLENLRFHTEEELNDKTFARKLASLGDLYINDAFGTSHRAHASVHGITKHLPSYAGLLLLAEQRALAQAVDSLKRPYLAIIGGGKIEKIHLIESLLQRVDRMIIVGVMANILLAARRVSIGSSKADPHAIVLAKRLALNKKIIAPLDVIVTTPHQHGHRICDVHSIKKDEQIVDIGPKTIALIESEVARSNTIFWAGPAGMYEHKPFDRGSKAIAHALSRSKQTTIIGGGDSAAIIHTLKLEKRITHISTGGGASIEYLEGKKLPGIEALK